MGTIKEVIDSILRIFEWWVSVSPWERGIRVRFGKYTKKLEPGIHFKIPLFDTIYLQTIRLRIVQLPLQTVSTKDGKCLSIVTAVGYSISDIIKLYNSIYQPESTITSIVLGEISEYVATHEIVDCLPSNIQSAVSTKLSSINNYGISYEYVKIVGFAVVKTFRLIQDGHYLNEGIQMDKKA